MQHYSQAVQLQQATQACPNDYGDIFSQWAAKRVCVLGLGYTDQFRSLP